MSTNFSRASPATRVRRPYAPRLPPEQRREQLLDAALHLIADQGYAGVSIEGVARFAGVTRPVVYDHFPNLGRLLHALFEREEGIALSQLERVVPGTPGEASPPEILLHGVRGFLESVASRPTTWRLILLPIDGTPANIRQHVERNRARIQERIVELIRWGGGRDGLPAGLDLELTAQAIRHLAEEAGRMVLTDADRHPPERYERYVRSIVGLIWPSPREAA
jgi:AcrR family transcriptional regulator